MQTAYRMIAVLGCFICSTVTGAQSAGTQSSLSCISTEVVTPHVKWCSPSATPPLEAIILVTDYGQREIVELIQRMDIKVRTSILTNYAPEEMLGDRSLVNYPKTGLTKEEMLRSARRLFDRRCDLIILSSSTWNFLEDDQKQKIRKMVASGTGLIFIDPMEKAKADWDILPVKAATANDAYCWNAPDEHPITTGVPLTLLPKTQFQVVEAKGQVIATAGPQRTPAIVIGTYGRGRTVAINYRTTDHPYLDSASLTPNYMGQFIPGKNKPLNQDYSLDYWEYIYSLLGKAILWVADAPRPVLITNVEAAGPIKLAGSAPAQVALTINSQAARSVNIDAAVHQDRGQRQYIESISASLKPGENRITVSIPKELLLDGSNLIDCWVRDQHQRIWDWATANVQATGPIRIVQVELDKLAFERSEPITGKIDISAADGLDGWVHISLLDPQGRLLWDHRQSTASGAVPMDVQVNSIPLNILVQCPLFCPHYLIVEAGAAARTFARHRTRVFITPPRDWDDFDACVWGSGSLKAMRMYLMPAVAKAMRQAGYTSYILNPYDWNHEYIAQVMSEGFRLARKAYGWVRQSAQPGSPPDRPVRKEYWGYSPLDDEAMTFAYKFGKGEDTATALDGLPGPNKMFGVLDTLAGDESSWGEHWGKEYLSKFRLWLEQQYGRIESLNAQWQSDFKSFEQVMPLTFKEAKAQGRFAPWVDFRIFDAHALSTWTGEVRRGMHEADPQGRLSMSGTRDPGSQNAYDWVRLVKACDSIRCYGTFQQALARSFNPGMPTARFTGYGGAQPSMAAWHTKLLLEGAHGISECSEHSLLNPDLTINRSCRTIAKDIIPMTRGIGKALIHAQRDNGPILVHYSYPSHCVAAMLDRDEAIQQTRMAMLCAWKGWGLIHETGYTYNFVSNEQIEAGKLQQGPEKLLFLTHAFAMSQAEADRIRRWVESGGVLVADLAPGIATNHGLLRPVGLLDDLFGVDRRKATLVIQEAVIKPTSAVNGVALTEPAPIGCYERFLLPTTATACGTVGPDGTPAILIRRAGKGMTVLLNGDPFIAYQAASKEDGSPENARVIRVLRLFLRSLADSADVQPLAELTADDGKIILHSYMARFKAGPVTYLGIVHGSTHEERASWPPRNVTLKLTQPANVYDIYEDELYPDTDTLHFSMPYMFRKLLSLLPYKVNEIRVESPQTTRPGQLAKLDLTIIADQPCGDHVVRMEVTDPNGEQRWYLGQNILAVKGAATVQLPFALNDPLGIWTLDFHDLTSGRRAQQKVELTSVE